jgi:hypothetical protein
MVIRRTPSPEPAVFIVAAPARRVAGDLSVDELQKMLQERIANGEVSDLD